MQIRGINWNVHVEGVGEAIVLLHGWGQNQYMMKFIADHFCSAFRVVNIDLPGFGESDEPPAVWNVSMYADGVHELLKELHITRPILIAHSFGARIAIRYATCYPVNKMVLTGAAGLLQRRGISYYARIYTYKLLKKLHMHVNMGSVDYQNASDIMKGVLIVSVNDDLKDCLPHIPCSTLLVWGERDTQTPLWMGKVMEEKIPDSTLIVLKKEDHFAYFHQSQHFIRIVESFLYG